MKLSVVTVTFNAANCIDKTLESLCRQRDVQYELIVVDGGSRDGTVERVKAHAQLSPLIQTGPDAGIYDAMNKGVAAATGDAIYFLNADDEFATGSALADLRDRLSAQPECGLVFGDVVVTDKDRDQYRSHQSVRTNRLGFEPLCHQATLARRELFDRIGGFDLSYRISADLDWFMRCAAVGVTFQYVPKLISLYAAGGESDKQSMLRRAENLQIIRKHLTPAQILQQRILAAARRRAGRLQLALLD